MSVLSFICLWLYFRFTLKFLYICLLYIFFIFRHLLSLFLSLTFFLFLFLSKNFKNMTQIACIFYLVLKVDDLKNIF
jgi:hypothetical protein